MLGQIQYQWQGMPAGYIPWNDPSNPCYKDPNSILEFPPPDSPQCLAWQRAHGGPISLTYTFQPGGGVPMTTTTSGSSSSGGVTSFLQQNGILIAGLAIGAVLLFALVK